MVKTSVAVLVCGTLFVAHLSAQEVFSGDQKARPKYPKAEAAKAEAKPEKAVAVAAAKPGTTSAHTAAPPQKPDNNSAKKVAAATIAKPSKPEKVQPAVETSSAKPVVKTITKATPTVMPGQRAPAATPSPIVKPEPPLIAKTQPTRTNLTSSASNPKAPLAAVPPPAKVAKAVSKPAAVETHKQPKVEAAVPNKAIAKENSANGSHPVASKVETPVDSHPKIVASSEAAKNGKPELKAQSAAKVAATTPQKTSVAVAKAPAPPAEGPKHDIVMQVKKPSVAQTKSNKAPAVVKTTVPAIKPVEETEEEETPTSARVSAKPATAPASTVAVKKFSLPKQTVDAHSVAAVPVSLQTRRDSSSAVTKAAFVQNTSAETVIPSPANDHFETAFTKLADGFDFPVGRPDAQGYYRARGFRSHGHLGEDWDGVGGGDTDLGDAIYAIGDGLVVFARDCHMGWGNVVIVRHSYRDGGAIRTIDSLYGHLQSILVRNGQAVARGQKIATMGTAHGLYDAHLHLEIRKNIEIGMSRAAFAQDFSNYYDPSNFITAHRHLQNGGGNYRVAMNTFTRDSRIRWDKVRNYSHAHTGGGTSQSSAALKRALAAKNE
jgi:murein DD-endopeptidase MepM/ murein hydrolase activator NlpD